MPTRPHHPGLVGADGDARFVEPSDASGPSTWAVQTKYRVGSIVRHLGKMYSCRQENVALAGWDPVSAPALWVPN
jgi:hypothetical protein